MSPLLATKIAFPILGLFGPLIVLVGLPGTWLVLALAGCAEWWTESRLFSTPVLVTAVVLTAAGEVWEFTASSVRAKRAGAGRRGSLGALGGGIAGALIGTVALPVPIIGTLVGGGLGAFGASTLLERSGGQTLGASLRVGRAAAVGQLLGLAGKLAASVFVYVILVVALLVGG